jgi:hypothetical protein
MSIGVGAKFSIKNLYFIKSKMYPIGWTLEKSLPDRVFLYIIN